MPSQAIFVGGGLAASPSFSATNESEGAGVIVTSDDPPAVGPANFGQDSTGFVWIQGGLTAAQRNTNQRKAITLGRGLVNLATAITGTQTAIIIGQDAGINITGGSVITAGIAIGQGAITDGTAVCIGAGVTCNCNNGSSAPTLINCVGVTGDLVSGVYIGTTTGGVVGAQSGVFIQGQCDNATGGGSVIISGRTENGAGLCIGGNGNANLNGSDGIALGRSSRAGGPQFGTAYSNCMAIGQNANATGTGATGNRHSIAIGWQSVATCDNVTAKPLAIGVDASATASGATGAAVALGASAIAATGQCVIGATGFPLELRIIAAAAGERLRVDAPAVAGQTALLVYDVDNNTLERVTVGVADSGGAGFKLLRIPN